MVHLYYAYPQRCRLDCDMLGIDRRRVIRLTGDLDTYVFTDKYGNRLDEPERMQLVAKLVVRQELVDKYIEDLRHDDDETWP